MVCINKLKGKIIEKGFTIESLANAINISKATMYRKIKDGGDSFSIEEAFLISKELNLTYEEINSIFFTQNIAQMRK